MVTPAPLWNSRRSAVLLFWCAENQKVLHWMVPVTSLTCVLPLPPVIEAISPVFLVLSCKFIGVFLSLSSENQERHQARHVLWRKDSQHSWLHVAQTGTRWPWSAAMPAYRLSAKTERHLSAAAVADKEFKAKACVCTVLFMHTRIKSTQSVTQLLHYTITRVRNN